MGLLRKCPKITCTHFNPFLNHEEHEEHEEITSCCFVVKEGLLFLDAPSVLQRYFDEGPSRVGQAFLPAMPNWPKGRLESLPHKLRPPAETSV